MILVDDRLTRQFAYTHYAVGIVHTVFLDRIYRRINFSAAAVEVGGMYMYAQRLSAHALCVYACGICKPVVRMDDVELLLACHHSCIHLCPGISTFALSSYLDTSAA